MALPCEFVQMEFLCFMTSEERTLISTLFDRLNSAAAQPKDSQADEYIRTKVSQQPSAPYLLVQSTLVMQQALTAAQTRIADLEKQLAAAQRPDEESSGSFLSGVANLFGVGQSPAQPPREARTPPTLPSQSAPLSKLSPPPLPQTGPGAGWRQLSAERPLDSSRCGWWGVTFPRHSEHVGPQSRPVRRIGWSLR